MENELEFTDRYKATGTPYPNPETMCKGQCEGMGIYPQFLTGPWLSPGSTQLVAEDVPTEEETRRWHEVHALSEHRAEKDADGIYMDRVCDGWHFITCPDCEGTGKAKPAEVSVKKG